MQIYRFTNTPKSADIDAAAALHLIPSGVRVYADRADFRARGGGDDPAPQNGTPKHWCYPGAKWNFEAPGMWFVFLDGAEAVNALAPGVKSDNRLNNIGLTNRETWGILSQANFYSTNAKYIPQIPRFRYEYVLNTEAQRLSIGDVPNRSAIPVAYLFEDPLGAIDWLTPDGIAAREPQGFKFRSTFPSDIGLRVVSGVAGIDDSPKMVEAFRIAEWTPPAAGNGQTFRSFSDAEQIEFLQATVNGPGSAESRAAKIRAFFER